MDNKFSGIDYGLFGITLAISAIIGIFCSRQKRKNDSNNASGNDMILGNQNLPLIPTTLSLLTSWVSGISILGIPAEIYLRGAGLWWMRVSGSLSFLFVAWVMIPIFFRLQLVSIYKYYQLRYNSQLIRYIFTIQCIVVLIAMVGVVFYAPAMALSDVTGVPYWIFVVTVGIVCTLYTSIGGIRAVVWTDTLQAVFMISGCLLLFIKGTLDTGGFNYTFSRAAELGKFDVLTTWNPSPFQYNNVWLTAMGGFWFYVGLIGANQVSLQRYLSLPNERTATIMAYISVPSFMIMFSLTDMIGVIMAVYYYGCDPISTNQVQTMDQMVIHFSLDVLGSFRGVPGIFLACIFSGTVSTASSGINSVVALIQEDFIKPFSKSPLPGTKLTSLARLVGFLTGIICIGTAFSVGPLGGIIKSILTFQGITYGISVGIFVAGMLFKATNRYGCYVAIVICYGFLGFVTFGIQQHKPYAKWAPGINSNNCTNATIGNLPNANFSTYADIAQNYYEDEPKKLSGINSLFYINDMNMSFLSAGMSSVIALIVSLIVKDKSMPTGSALSRLLAFYQDEEEQDIRLEKEPQKKDVYAGLIKLDFHMDED